MAGDVTAKALVVSQKRLLSAAKRSSFRIAAEGGVPRPALSAQDEKDADADAYCCMTWRPKKAE